MRVLITGGNGYLGHSLTHRAALSHNVIYTTYRGAPLTDVAAESVRLDVRQAEAVDALIDRVRPDVIIHTAGSNRTPDMVDVIVQGTRHISAAAQRLGARLIFLSTDVVFDGTAGPYAESAEPHPLHAYGQAKVAAEALARATPAAVIVRTSLIYDLDRVDHNLAWIMDAWQRGANVTLFTNQLRNPITAATLAAALLELIDHPYIGNLHIAGHQSLSRADFSLRLLDYWGLRDGGPITLAPDRSNLYPLDTRLDTRLARQILRTSLSGVDETLPPSGHRNTTARPGTP